MNIYRLRPGDLRGRKFEMQVKIHTESMTQPLRAPPYGHANTKMHGLEMVLGAQYVVELVLTNRAGGISRMISPRIVCDYLPPICTTPLLSAGGGKPMVQAQTFPPGATRYSGTRVHSWVREDSTEISVHINNFVCADKESRVMKMEMWVGSKRDALDDIIPRQEVLPDTVHRLPIVPQKDYKDRLECDHCGSDTVIGIRCLNGANMSKVCQRYGSVRVDGSPPICKPQGFVMIGPTTGRNKGFQSDTVGFAVSNFNYAIEDRETGIANVTYTLLDLGVRPTDEVPLVDITPGAPTPVAVATHSLAWIDHDGLPSHRFPVHGLNLLSHHTYTIQFIATNFLGRVGPPCYTSQVMVDTTPPVPGPVILLQHDSDNEVDMPTPSYFQYSREVMRVAVRDWHDPESGILGYAATVYRVDGFIIQVTRHTGSQDALTAPLPALLLFARSDSCTVRAPFAGSRACGLALGPLSPFRSTFSIARHSSSSGNASTGRCSRRASIRRSSPSTARRQSSIVRELAAEPNSLGGCIPPLSLSLAILTHTLAPYPFLADVHDVFMSTVPTLGGREADLVGATSLEIGTLFSSRDGESGIRDASWCLGSFPGACDVMPLRAVEHALRESQQSSE